MLGRLGPCTRPKETLVLRLDDDTLRAVRRDSALNTASSPGVRRRDFSRACAESAPTSARRPASGQPPLAAWMTGTTRPTKVAVMVARYCYS
ncbi:hypothetical protein MRX96_045187 [Rhipicephalus microplus]